jgi:hypothetical protein
MVVPPAIRDWLVARIERSWHEPERIFAAFPEELPAGQVQRLAGAGPFGLMLDGRLDEIDGRLALEVLENSRMSGESYFRVWDDGTIEPLEPAPRPEFAVPSKSTPEERAAAEEAYFEHNRVAYEHLRERGFFGS